jgi:WhiB family transcriptional regulator, redox-sensing transcriptional regulator
LDRFSEVRDHGGRRTNRGVGVPPTGSPILPLSTQFVGGNDYTHGGFLVSATETITSLIFTGPLAWTDSAACRGQNELFFAPAGERPETRSVREAKARAVCNGCAVMSPCRDWARENREYGYWGGESEEERAAAGYRVDMPVGRVARYPKGNGTPVRPRAPRVA